MNFLYESGYIHLNGVEINETAVEILKDSFPEMSNVINIYNAPIEQVIKDFKKDQFDIIFTMAVLEHIHEDSEWIFPEMVRITKHYIVTIEDESGLSYRHFPRDYKKVFEPLGLEQIKKQKCTHIEGLGDNFFARIFKKNNTTQ